MNLGRAAGGWRPISAVGIAVPGIVLVDFLSGKKARNV
jgi:hypothetical protein